MTLYQILHDEGFAEGLAVAELIPSRAFRVRHGTKRFGAPDSNTLAAVNAVQEMERLDALIDRMFLFSNWEELLK